MITVFGGMVGSGKTLWSVYFGKYFKEKGFKVYANFDVVFAKKVNPLDIIDYSLNNCVCLFDEWDTFFDARISSTKTNRLQSYFYKQTRKRHVHIFGNAQFLRRIDYSGRNLAEHRFICNCIRDPEKVDKRTGEKKPLTFELYKENVFGDFYRSNNVPASFFEPYFKMYDTKEIILPFDFKGLDFDIIKELFEESEENKKKFGLFMRAEYNGVSISRCNDIFELMKLKEYNRVKYVIRNS